MSIKISPTHGVNPTIPICAFCGKPKNEIALLGKLPNDAEAPHECLLDYEPCDECKAKLEQGFALICAGETPQSPNQPPIIAAGGKKLYPTGKWCVITHEAAEHIFGETITKKADGTRQTKALIDETVFDAIMKSTEN